MSKDEFKAMLAAKMKEIRKEYQPKMNQLALSKKLKTTNQTISNIENNIYSPSVDMMFDWANATGHEVSIIFTPKPSKTI